MREYACTRRELSCIIGNLFTELDPPCAACDSDADELTISGRTYTPVSYTHLTLPTN